MSYQINSTTCEMCGACKSECPVSAISMKGMYYQVNEDTCVECGSCENVCGYDSIKKKE